MLRIKGLSFSYDSAEALRDVSMSVEEGEVVAVLGPNGSGKSTLLKAAARILRPAEGCVYIDGRDVLHMEDRALARTVGYVPQWEERSMPQTVFNAVLMGRLPHFSWNPGEEDTERTAAVLERMGLSDCAARYTDELSGGERQKVLIARALAQEARVLLLDEPTANLDLRHQLEVMEIIRSEAEKGLAALVAIHDVNLALRYCHRFILMKSGSILAAGPADIITEDTIRTVYGIRCTIHKTPTHKFVIPEGVG